MILFSSAKRLSFPHKISQNTAHSSLCHFRNMRLSLFSTLLLTLTVLLCLVEISLANGFHEINYKYPTAPCKQEQKFRSEAHAHSPEFYNAKNSEKRRFLEGIGFDCHTAVLRPEEPCPKKKDELIPVEKVEKPCEEEVPQEVIEFTNGLKDKGDELMAVTIEAVELLNKISGHLISVSSTNRCDPVIELHTSFRPNKCPTKPFKCPPKERCKDNEDNRPNAPLKLIENVVLPYPLEKPIEEYIKSAKANPTNYKLEIEKSIALSKARRL